MWSLPISSEVPVSKEIDSCVDESSNPSKTAMRDVANASVDKTGVVVKKSAHSSIEGASKIISKILR